jgi:hypothetical protein
MKINYRSKRMTVSYGVLSRSLIQNICIQSYAPMVTAYTASKVCIILLKTRESYRHAPEQCSQTPEKKWCGGGTGRK